MSEFSYSEYSIFQHLCYGGTEVQPAVIHQKLHEDVVYDETFIPSSE
jgi:hypothetical protein